LRERDNLEAPVVGGKMIFRWIFRKGGGAWTWVDVAQDRDWWRALVNAVVNGQGLVAGTCKRGCGRTGTGGGHL